LNNPSVNPNRTNSKEECPCCGYLWTEEGGYDCVFMYHKKPDEDKK